MPGEIFHPFRLLLSQTKFYLVIFLSHVNDYIESVATFTALVNFFFSNFAKEAGLGEFFFQRKFLAARMAFMYKFSIHS